MQEMLLTFGTSLGVANLGLVAGGTLTAWWQRAEQRSDPAVQRLLNFNCSKKAGKCVVY
jgi:hypothetical protein